MKLESMSSNIVNLMTTLAKNEGLARLLTYDVPNPFENNLPAPDWRELVKPNGSKAKIFPYPFSPEATTDDGSFIRVYYNQGEFNGNEVIADSDINFDIIVAKGLWTIDDGERSLLRPYEMLGRVVDLVGRNGIGRTRLKAEGFQFMYINTKFDAIRLYTKYMSVET
ncbi:hypothetical protein IEN91_04565 [Bacillus velezensis]|uniref:hypothetical protein n=1 Tax=Bacillus velezensis TaxID=492670 RepID=UPI0018C7F948|nr:hypothetical protein [Bacillus velezensis]QPK89728.1 hypothetical protein IEN91_04565 [Bacillus velezensis]